MSDFKKSYAHISCNLYYYIVCNIVKLWRPIRKSCFCSRWHLGHKNKKSSIACSYNANRKYKLLMLRFILSIWMLKKQKCDNSSCKIKKTLWLRQVSNPVMDRSSSSIVFSFSQLTPWATLTGWWVVRFIEYLKLNLIPWTFSRIAVLKASKRTFGCC